MKTCSKKAIYVITPQETELHILNDGLKF